ncbi:proline-rich transmembrane protein 4-like [Orbicella faveolata]|uniref:proline-rich transmembrane protein 4-like n=1 Tax=Orbicella faveolata TaxID=48498 RepID=UPI0009E4DF58|nr:proline-rich transmembrane protein 4-like [Orbicella faveolata]XP_020604086.1 proline-rich transmembrane protein 4-like [Orbicella faveolata]XP_020604087.1 proline-rich transmembrane protein 4-like [Orbicella faveolata]
MKTWKQTWYSAVILTLLFFLLKNSVESKDVVYPKKEQPKRDNNEKTHADTKHRQVNNNLKKLDLFSLEKIDRGSSSQKTSPARKRLNTHKTLEHRETLDGEDINSSRSVQCSHVQNRKVDNHISKAQKERGHRNTIAHFEDRGSDRPLKRHKRQPRPRPAGPSSEPPEGSPEGEPERSSGEPVATTKPTLEPEISWPEPEPDWPKAFAKWQDAWPLHTYGFAAVFTIIALIPPFELLRMHVDKTKMTALKSSLLVTIFIFSSTRAIALFVDPYGSTNRFHLIITQLLFALGHPCIISALSLLLLVLIDTTKMNIAPPKFQRIKFIVPVVISHVALVIVTDFVVVYFLEAKILLLMCQIYFLSLGILLAVGYARVGWKIRTNIRANVNSKSAVDNSMRRLQYLIAACAVASALISALTIYGAAGVFGIYSGVRYVNPWPWWIFQTCNRILETTICIVVLLMNTKASNKRKIFPAAHSFMTKSLFQSRRNTAKAKKTTPKETAGCQSITSTE